eukprot:gene34528-44631_t
MALLISSSAATGIFVGWGLSYLFFTQNSRKQKLESRHTNNAIEDYPLAIRTELTSRVRTFFGEDGFKRLENSYVIVVGLGGVGSHCANMLVRSGVGKIRLIDFDQVSLSSLNRHALAEMGDVGHSKVEAMQRHLQRIVPWCEVQAVREMFRIEDAERLLLSGSPSGPSASSNQSSSRPAFVVDCIDDVLTKADLIAFCLRNNLEADPTRLRLTSLSDCMNDPLASKLKWRLKKLGASADDVASLFSVEKPVCNLLPLTQEQRDNPQDFGVVDYLRVRVMPVLGTSPSIFGQALASFVLCKLA